jgi:hypothetical protein
MPPVTRAQVAPELRGAVRSIPTIGWPFLPQVIAGFVFAAAVLAARSPLAAAAGAGFALATLGRYLPSVWIGLFGGSGKYASRQGSPPG